MRHDDAVESAPPPVRIEPVQWLRGVAASLVLFDHALNTLARDGGDAALAIPNLATFGASGVDLFFVISGFVMAQSLATLPQRGAAAFLKARWLRIVPLFVVMSAAYLVVLGAPVAWQSMLMTLTVLPVFDTSGYHVPLLWVGWTLGFEFAFYAIVAVAAALPGDRRVLHLFTLTMAAALGGLVVHPPWAPLRLLANPLLLEFALGVAVWLVWRKAWMQRCAPAALVTGIALLAVGLAVGMGLPVNVHYDGAANGSAGLARTWTWGLPWALVMAGMLGEQRCGTVSAALRAIGNASYATYLVHPAVLILAGRHLDLTTFPPAAAIAMLILAATVAGMTIHAAIERPLLRVMQRRRLAQDRWRFRTLPAAEPL